jgi:hypothetical protein
VLDDDFLMYSGVDQSSVASLVSDGLHYECYVWLNKADCRIEALCTVLHPVDGESVVFHNIIDQADAAAISGTSGYPLDCPKIIASGVHFVVHWLFASAADGGGIRQWALHRATMDMESFDTSTGGWTAQGATTLYEDYALYDVAPVIGAAASGSGGVPFLVARSTAVDEITVERFTTTNFLWASTDWSTALTVEHEGRVLAVYGHEDDNDVLVTYERTGVEEEEGGALWSWHLDADDGDEAGSDVQTFVDFSFTDPHGPFDNSPVLTTTGARWCQVGHCRVAANQVAVVGEAVLIDIVGAGKPYTFIHHLAYRMIISADATRLGDEWWCPHLSMVSLPFAYDNGTTAAGSAPNVYVTVSYKSIYPTSDWEQATIWCVDLNFARWTAEDSGQQLRPRPIATLSSVGIPDARVSGWHPEAEDSGLTDVPPLNGPSKRVNHISGVALAPPFGPQIKTRTVAVGIWAQMGSVATDPSTLATDQALDVETDTEDPETDATTIATSGGELQPENNGVTGFVIHIEDPWTIFRDSTDPTQPVDNFVGAYSRAACQAVEVGRGLAIFGGTPYYYDGERVGELGFPWAPEIILLAGGEASGGDPGDLELTTTYRYYVVATRRDRQGTVHRSRPSRIASYTLTGANNSIQIRIRTCTLSLWESSVFYPTAPAVNFEVFRTTGDGAIFYRLYGARQSLGYSRPRDTPTNNPLAIWGYVDFEDGLDDAELILQGVAPFTLGAGGFLELTPQTVPALTCPAVWQSRLWGADLLDPSLLWYSDEILPEFASDYYRAPEFNDVNTLRIDGKGEVVALAPMLNELIVFTRDGVYAVQGQGNNGLGQGANLQLSTLHEGTGCIEPRSIVLAPPGIFFQTEKGYYLLGRGKEADFANAGAPIDDDVRDAGNIRAATLLADRHQIRLACNGRPVTTYTTTWEISQDTFGATFSITLTGVGAPGLIASTENADGDTDTEIAERLVADIDALLDVRSSGLHLYIASASVVGDDVVVVWQPDVVPSYTDLPNGPGNSLIATDTSELEVLPRVLTYDYLFKQWSRGVLQPVSSTERLNEVVGACAWRGHDGGIAHVVLQQGALRIERSERDALAYSDQLANGTEVGIPIDLRTTPFHPAGFSGYHRIRSIGVQAKKPNMSELHVDLEFYTSGDYDVPDAVDLDVTVDTRSPPYMRVRPRIQKATIGMRIYEESGVVNRQNVSVVGLVFEVGMKKGPRRVANSQIAR